LPIFEYRATFFAAGGARREVPLLLKTTEKTHDCRIPPAIMICRPVTCLAALLVLLLVPAAHAADPSQHWKLDDFALNYTADRAALQNEIPGGGLAQTNHAGSLADAPATGLPGATAAPGTAIGLNTRFQRIELGAVSPGVQPFTFAFWFKRNSAAISGFDVSTEGTPQEHILSANQSQSGRWNLHASNLNAATQRFDLSFFHHNGVGSVKVATDLDSDVWQHLVISRDPGNLLKFFLNAAEIYSATDAASFTHGANGVFLGRDPGLFSNGSRGTAAAFDDVRIYNSALTPAEISALAEPRPPTPPWELPPLPAEDFTTIRDPYGDVPGSVIANSTNPAGLYLGTPSVVIMPDGSHVASHDFFGPASGNRFARILRSTDAGRTWREIANLDAYWSNLFLHDGALYFMGPNRARNQVVLRRSNDGGFTWTEPTNASNGVLLTGSFHSSAMPMLVHNGRIWRAMEDQNGPSSAWGRIFRAFMMSAPLTADLLNAGSWTSSNILATSTSWLGGQMNGWLEGNAVAAPDGSVKNILRVDTNPNQDDIAAVIHYSADGSTASFDPEGRPGSNSADLSGFITLPGATKKFVIRRDPVTGDYWSLTSHIMPQDLGGDPERIRNTLALIRSTDLFNWEIRSIVLHHPGVGNYGFHYVDWQFDGDDLAVASRAAWNADNQHNSNLILFHRVENFRGLELADSVPSGEALWDYPEMTIQGVGFRPAMLGEGELAFSNRTYRWQGVPAALAGQFILRINGGTIPQIHVTAKRDLTLRVATASASGPPGWTAEGITFGYNANTNTPLYLFSKAMASGEQLDIPQLGFSGTLPIIRPSSRPLARWRVTPGALPAVADSENAFHIDTINGNGPRAAQGVAGAGLDFSNALAPVTGQNQLGLVDMDFTLAAWIHTRPGDTSANQAIIGKGTSFGGASWLLSLNRTEMGKATFTIGSTSLTSTTPVNDGHWHHLAVSYTRGGQMSLHIDGSPPQASAPAPAIPATTGPIFLGGAGGILSFRGGLDEIQLHPRPLDTAEITSLFLHPASADPAPGRGLPSWFHRDGGGFVLSWPAIPGRNYQVYRSTSLARDSWLPVEAFEAEADWIEWRPAIDAPRAFYQVRFTAYR